MELWPTVGTWPGFTETLVINVGQSHDHNDTYLASAIYGVTSSERLKLEPEPKPEPALQLEPEPNPTYELTCGRALPVS